MTRLAIVTSHPVQYYAPWFRFISQTCPDVQLKVFYLWDFGIRPQTDPGFKDVVVWDLPLLDGYEHEFVPNVSRDPGTHHFWGLQNPELRQRLFAWKPDAALLIGYNHASLTHLILRAGRLPLLFRGDSHLLSPPPNTWRQGINRSLRRLIFSKFRAFLAVGKANRDYFLQQRIPSHRIFLAPHCIDNSRFSEAATSAARIAWRQEFSIPLDERVILFAGKFETKKRPDLLLEAFAAGVPENTSLLFVGGGEWEPALRERSRQLNRKVRFAPFQNQSRMPATYAAADVLVLPSSGNRETWGLAVNEAMACGIPAIVSSVVGCGPDLVIPGKTGWIFPADNAVELNACLHSALADEARRKEMGNHARQWVTDHFHFGSATDGLTKALQAIQSSKC